MTSSQNESIHNKLTSDGLVDADGVCVGEVDGDSEVDGGNDGLVEGLIEGLIEGPVEGPSEGGYDLKTSRTRVTNKS